jgi:hypothetical protein
VHGAGRSPLRGGILRICLMFVGVDNRNNDSDAY